MLPTEISQTALNIRATTETWMSSSLVIMFLNVCGYATVLVPGYLLIRYIRSSGYLNTAGTGCVPNVVRLCIQGDTNAAGADVEEGKEDKEVNTDKQPPPAAERTFLQTCSVMCFCSVGLLVSYLLWGLVQERIMTLEYGKQENDPNQPGERFKNSLFLEFSNRFLAVFLAAFILLFGCCFGRQPKHTAPLYKYSYCSISNVMSGWCQYEALKYVSFPLQVMAKASKVIPVMLMGRLVSKQTYSTMEYVTALLISVGLFLFLFTSKDSVRTDTRTASITGIALLLGYLFFDAFTSNWQAQLFKTHHMSSVQMMAGLNLFSVILTSVSLLEQGGFIEAAAFMTRHPEFILHIFALAVASTVGQLFIYYTIDQFGAATFVIIMTIRQAFAIFLSCLFYHHPVHALGIVGIVICFGAIFVRIYWHNSIAAGHAQHSKAFVRTRTITKTLPTH